MDNPQYEERQAVRTVVRGTYDIQNLRIQTGNRIVANFKARLGQAPSEKEETMDKEAKDILANLRKEFDRITDGVAIFPRASSFKGTELISSYTELTLMDEYLALEKAEKNSFKRLGHILKDFGVWTEFLEGIRGVGPTIAGVIVSEINIYAAEYPSSIHKYAGLDVVNGAGRSRKKEHLSKSSYTDKNGEEKEKMGITFNPFLKTKLIGVLGPSFIKQPAEKSIYPTIYDNYKHRIEHMPAHKDKSLKHRHNMAVRYMIKRFLTDLYKAWRELEELPVAPEYSEAKLGMTHVSAKKYGEAA